MLAPELIQQLGWSQPAPPPMPVAVVPPDAQPVVPDVAPPEPYAPPEPELSPVLSGTPPAPPPTGIAAPTSPSQGDYSVPASAIDGPGRTGESSSSSTTIQMNRPQPRPGGPLKLPEPGRKFAGAEEAQQKANLASQYANAVDTQVQVEKANETQVLFDENKAELDRLKQQETAFNEQSAKTLVEKRSILDARRKQHEDYKVDQNKYWRDLGIGNKIGWYIGIALSSIGDAMRGANGPNPVIQMLRDKATEAINMQLDEREQLEKKVGRAEKDVDQWNAFSKDRQAQFLALSAEAYRALGMAIQRTSAKFASREAQAKGMKEAAELFQEAAKKDDAAAIQAAEFDMKQQGLDIQRGHLAIAQREERRKQAEAKAQEQVWTPDELVAINTTPDGRVPPRPKIAMTQKQFDNWIGTQKGIEQYTAAARENNPDERVKQLSVPGVQTDTAKPALFKNADLATEIGKAKGLFEDLIRATDEMRVLIDKHGYEPKFWRSKEGQAARTTYYHVLVQTKEKDKLGVLNVGDKPVLEGQIGTDDPGELRSRLEGVTNFRHQQIEQFNTQLRNLVVLPPGEKLARIDPVDPLKLPEPPKTQEQINLEVVLGKRPDPGATYNPDLKRFEPNLPGLNNPNAQRARQEALVGGAAAPLDPKARATAAESAAPYKERGSDTVSRKYPDLGGGTRALLESTWLQLGSTDPAVRANAKVFLDEAARSSSIDDVSDYAKELLKKKPKWDQVETPGRSVAPAAPTQPSLPPQVLQRLGLGAQ